jgi:hypothetical protein
MAKTSFLPSLHGFHFPNNFVNNLVSTPVGSITTGGRCGGMAYASLDYFFHQTPVPNCIANSPAVASVNDFPASGGVPPDGTVLADFILLRLMTTFAQYGYTSLMWNSASDHSTWIGPGRVPATKNNEWPKLQAHLDQGTPVTIGMVNCDGSLGDAHQVVVYDYNIGSDASGNQLITISIYDNRFPDDDTITIQSTVDLWANPHWNEASSINQISDIWAGWWVEDGTPASWWGVAGWMVQPMSWALAAGILALVPGTVLPSLLSFDFGISPGSTEGDLISGLVQLMTTSPAGGLATPPLIDLVLSDPITPNPATEFLTETYQPNFTIMNQGPYMAHAQFLSLVSGDAPLDALLHDATNPLALSPGQSFSPSIQCQVPADISPGPFNLSAQYMTMEQHSIVLPAVSGIVNSATLSVFPAPAVAISVLAETQGEKVEAGVTVGGWNVVLQASPAPPAFTPVNYEWTIDSGPSRQTASGQIVTLFLAVGAQGQPFTYSHTVSVIATDAQGDTASATYSLVFTTPQATLTTQIDPRSKNQVKVYSWGSGTDWLEVTSTIPSLEDALLENVAHFFSPLTVTWSPQPNYLQNSDLTAVYSMNGNSVWVTTTITDTIGQKLTLSGWLIGAFNQYTHGPGWTPPQLPGKGSSDQNQNPNPRDINLSSSSRSRVGHSPIGIAEKQATGSPKGTLVTGVDLIDHVRLVRQFSKDRRTGKKGK